MRARGFTLIEVVIAMFVAAIMFAIGYGAINQALVDRDALNVSQARVTEIQRGMRVIAQDFAQMAARAARDTSGTGQLVPAVFADARNDIAAHVLAHWLEQSRGQSQRPAEQRVRYRFIDGSLVREHWLSIDPALNTEPRQRVLLTRVKAVEIRFLDPVSRQWRTEWPTAAASTAAAHACHGRPVAGPPARHRVHRGARGLGPRAAPVRDPDVKHARQRGIALLVAIVMFAIATTVAAAITYNKAMAARRAAATFTLEQALQAGMAAEAPRAARTRGRWQQREDRHPTSPGRSRSGPSRSKAPASGSRRQLEDLSGRFNLNSVVEWQGAPTQYFRRGSAPGRGVPRRCSNDWTIDARYVGSAGRLDRHRQRSHEPQGGEDTLYLSQSPPYRPPNTFITARLRVAGAARLRRRELREDRALRDGAAERREGQHLHRQRHWCSMPTANDPKPRWPTGIQDLEDAARERLLPDQADFLAGIHDANVRALAQARRAGKVRRGSGCAPTFALAPRSSFCTVFYSAKRTTVSVPCNAALEANTDDRIADHSPSRRRLTPVDGVQRRRPRGGQRRVRRSRAGDGDEHRPARRRHPSRQRSARDRERCARQRRGQARAGHSLRARRTRRRRNRESALRDRRSGFRHGPRAGRGDRARAHRCAARRAARRRSRAAGYLLRSDVVAGDAGPDDRAARRRHAHAAHRRRAAAGAARAVDRRRFRDGAGHAGFGGGRARARAARPVAVRRP